MALTALCPSCGAPVVFRSAGSLFAVCEYCRSTLVRHDQALEDIGKMAALAEDRSPLRLGAEGSHGGVHFALIGRIQIKFSQGYWNEWHLLFDDQRTGWLSEAGGEYVLTFTQPVLEPLPAFAELKIGQRLLLAGQPWTVSNLENAECVAGEGELPFKVGAGYPVAAVDLRNAGGFATLDYSETPPLLFVGQAVDFAALRLSGLRDGMASPAKTVAVQVFRCPACGAPLQARSADVLAVGCATCGAVIDAADPSHRVLTAARGLRDEEYAPRIALGSKGLLDGEPVEVIGFLVKRTTVDGIDDDWREYLLAGEHGTYRWLTEYDGHWNVVDVLSNPPRSSGIVEVDDVRHGDRRFRHFATTQAAEVVQVTGEFTWQVRRGETTRIVDYVAPPQMLSRESTANDLTWSLGTYVAPETIADAFKLTGRMIAPAGVYANQPNPWADTHRRAWRIFWRLALAAVVLQVFFHFIAGGRLLLRQDVTFSPQMAEDSVVTREFEIKGRPRKVTVRNSTSLDNNWIGLDLLLVNKATGEARPVARELAFYHGVDDGERWSEGSRDDEVVFLAVPPGTYYVAVDPDIAPEKPVPVRDVIEVYSGGAGWSNFVMVMLFLAAFPFFTRLRQAAFEARRWAESDHAPAASSGDAVEGDD